MPSASPPEPPEPTNPEQVRLRIQAVGLHPVVRARGAGVHPTALGASLPFDPSVDGVGLYEPSSELFYITALAAPLLAEYATINVQDLVPLGGKADVDPVVIAALVNPVSSSWMALHHRISRSVAGLVILILGITSTSGRAAAQVARFLGAARIIGVSRTLAQIDEVDEHILLPVDKPLDLSRGIGHVHVVLDYIGGRVAADALQSAVVPPGGDIEYVHIGDLGGQDDLPLFGRLLNTKAIRVMGSGMGSWSKADLQSEIHGIVSFTARMERPQNVVTCKLDDIESAWNTQKPGTRTVVAP